MQAGALSSRELTERYLDRIACFDASGPAINAVVELNPDAVAIADALDRERASRGPRGPLHGIPVLIKDNLDTADRMATAAGSLALSECGAARDAFVVERLRAAGCVLLGKSNMSEWANFRSVDSTSGWSARGGLTRNPYALDRNASGSSSGSAAAVAANLCTVAVGTETDGSIVNPASVCGIVGIKPTVGLVSRRGMVPLSPSQDTPGPMARFVADAAELLNVMAGFDPQDASCLDSRRSVCDYTLSLDEAGLRGARIGVMRNDAGLDRACGKVLQAAIAVMRDAGATVVDPVRVIAPGALHAAEFDCVVDYEFKSAMNGYLAAREAGTIRSLDAVIRFNERNAAREMPYFGQDLLVKAERASVKGERDYARVLAGKRRLAGTEGIDAALRTHRLHAIIAITAGPAWVSDLIAGDRETGSCAQPAAVAGYPHITVPAGERFGLPIGVSFFASAYSEPTLIRLAYAFEQATKARQRPRYLATANLTGDEG